MRRPIRLIAALAALFGLQAPLCAIACLEGPGPEPAAVAQHDAPPCHQTTPPPGSPQAPSSHDDCGCDSSVEALTQLPEELRTSAAHALVSQTLGGPATAPIAQWRPDARRRADLPPPDILLLKSTLLI